MTTKGKRRISNDDMGWDDEFKKGAWTAEEDAVLRAAVCVRVSPLACAPYRQPAMPHLCAERELRTNAAVFPCLGFAPAIPSASATAWACPRIGRAHAAGGDTL